MADFTFHDYRHGMLLNAISNERAFQESQERLRQGRMGLALQQRQLQQQAAIQQETMLQHVEQTKLQEERVRLQEKSVERAMAHYHFMEEKAAEQAAKDAEWQRTLGARVGRLQDDMRAIAQGGSPPVKPESAQHFETPGGVAAFEQQTGAPPSAEAPPSEPARQPVGLTDALTRHSKLVDYAAGVLPLLSMDAHTRPIGNALVQGLKLQGTGLRELLKDQAETAKAQNIATNIAPRQKAAIESAGRIAVPTEKGTFTSVAPVKEAKPQPTPGEKQADYVLRNLGWAMEQQPFGMTEPEKRAAAIKWLRDAYDEIKGTPTGSRVWNVINGEAVLSK